MQITQDNSGTTIYLQLVTTVSTKYLTFLKSSLVIQKFANNFFVSEKIFSS
jgi:hypothetical protein